MKVVPLSGGEGRKALVSPEDFDHVMQHRWHYANGYAATAIERRTTYMHRFILKPPPGLVVDHVNHDGLDNRRENIRIGTQTQNMANMRPYDGKVSRHKGVYWDESRELWRARIKQHRTYHYLGAYLDEDDAGRAYDAAARWLFGEFAFTNFDGMLAKPPALIVVEARSRLSERPKTGYFGVTKRTRSNGYVGRVAINGERLTVGSSLSAHAVALLVDQAIRQAIATGQKVSGHARLNFLDADEGT